MRYAEKVSNCAGVRVLIVLLGLYGGWSRPVSAQSCTGVLGEAVVNQTFGSDEPYRLQPGQTTYRNVASCPNDGEYLIAPATTCYGTNWHSLFDDHTPGDVKGNLLIVNAAQEAGEFYRQTVPSLCNGTTYEFSAWIINLVNTSSANGCNALEPVRLDPNVTLRVELPNGQVLKTINTGSVTRTATPTWLRYATVFTLPAGTNSVVVKLINNSLGGCGNDLALDDIQLRPCRPQLQVRFLEAATTTISVCEGSGVTLGSVLGSGYDPSYQWQTSTDSVSWRAIAGAGEATFNAPASPTGIRYYRLLSAPTPGGLGGGCSAVSNTLTVRTIPAGDCGAPYFYVPDAFTPNSDGVNDGFRAHFNERAARLERYQLRVFNRWGSVIFASNDLAQPWDGTFSARPCDGDVYLWVLEGELARDSQTQHFTKQGRVLLIR